MRLRSLIVLGTAALLLVSGCAPQPTPKPTAPPSASSSPSASPTPTPEPVVEPDAAFDVTCDDVAAEMEALVGAPSTPVEPVMSVIATMSWLPGPAQYMFQRTGGIACSAGDEARHWEVTIVPDAPAVIEGATERQGYWGERAECGEGRCSFEFPDGDVLLSAVVSDPAIGSADTGRLEESLRRLAADAAASAREVEYIDSDIPGLPCERFITPQEVNEIVGATDALMYNDFGGWGIPAEVYNVVNGSRICYYTSGDQYYGDSYLLLTTLPAGAWAFDEVDGTVVAVDGADEAKMSTDPQGGRILDVRVGVDWLRFKTYENESGVSDDPTPLAEKVLRNLAVGHTAPQ